MRHWNSLRLQAGAFAAVGAMLLAPASLGSPPEGTTPPTVGDADAVVIDRHIVVFDEHGLNPLERERELRACIEFVERRGGTVHHEYHAALTGFAATLPDDVLEALETHPSIAYIEQDQLVQTATACHLDRVDQRDLPLDNVYSPHGNGLGTTIWVIDTGVRATHIEFGARAQQVVNFTDDGNFDANCHGTWVASIAAGYTYGVAPGAQIRGVKVLDSRGAGYTSDVVSGIEYVQNWADSSAVACLALGGGYSLSLNTAVCNLVNSGVCTVVAASNEDQDACHTSPASAICAVTVAATNCQTDRRASFSNWGSCVDIFAPGVENTGAWCISDTTTNSLTGTSAAVAVAAGAAAVYGADCNALLANATEGEVIDPGPGSPNLLVYVGP